MQRRSWKWLGLLTLSVVILAVIAAPVVLLWPLEGPFFIADFERIKLGMTLSEVEAIFGPPLADEESGLVPSPTGRPPFWKAWRGDVNDLHMLFDADGRVDAALLHPRKLFLFHRLIEP